MTTWKKVFIFVNCIFVNYIFVPISRAALKHEIMFNYPVFIHSIATQADKSKYISLIGSVATQQFSFSPPVGSIDFRANRNGHYLMIFGGAQCIGSVTMFNVSLDRKHCDCCVSDDLIITSSVGLFSFLFICAACRCVVFTYVRVYVGE